MVSKAFGKAVSNSATNEVSEDTHHSAWGQALEVAHSWTLVDLSKLFQERWKVQPSRECMFFPSHTSISFVVLLDKYINFE